MGIKELRPVEIHYTEKHHGFEKKFNGFFHLFFKRVMDDGTEYPLALIELEDGKMIEVEPIFMRFTDRSSDEKKNSLD